MHTRVVSWSKANLTAVLPHTRGVSQSYRTQERSVGQANPYGQKPTTPHTRAVNWSSQPLPHMLVKSQLHYTQEQSVGQANAYRIQGQSAGQKPTLPHKRAVSWSRLCLTSTA